MKQYNNGQRKAMSYGGMPMRKPMMKGGIAKKKPRKKMQMGGMSTTQQQQNMQQNMMPTNMTSGQMNQMQTDMMQTPKLRMMAGGIAGDIKATKKKEKKKTDRQLLAESDPTRKTPFGRLSIEAGIDNNPNPTQADRIAGARMRKKI